MLAGNQETWPQEPLAPTHTGREGATWGGEIHDGTGGWGGRGIVIKRAGNQRTEGDRDLFNRHLLCVSCVPGTVVDTGDTAVDERDTFLPFGESIPVGETR